MLNIKIKDLKEVGKVSEAVMEESGIWHVGRTKYTADKRWANSPDHGKTTYKGKLGEDIMKNHLIESLYDGMAEELFGHKIKSVMMFRDFYSDQDMLITLADKKRTTLRASIKTQTPFVTRESVSHPTKKSQIDHAMDCDGGIFWLLTHDSHLLPKFGDKTKAMDGTILWASQSSLANILNVEDAA